jgi:GNAT superfamily N-acetyltransferase
MLIDDYFVFLESNGDEASLEIGDPSDFIYVTTGEIVGTDEAQQKICMGKFSLSYIDVEATINARECSVFDVFDSSQETCDYYSAIFTPGTLKSSKELTDLFRGELWLGNVLILDRLEILPAFRRHKLGLLVLRRLMERFGAGAAVVAMKPFPLQCEDRIRPDDDWRSSLRLGDFEKEFKRATSKLRRYYAKLGFKAMKGTPFMFRDPQRALPSPEKLAGKS